MRFGLMQPYFFPYLGYFQLIAAVDHYVFFDTTQYEYGGWMNRNRILNLQRDFTYLTIPIQRAPLETPLNAIYVNDVENCQMMMMRQLDVYRKRAPYFDEVSDIVRSVITGTNEKLSEINIRSVLYVCDYLGLSFEYEVYSNLALDVPEHCKGDEWALHITKAMGYDTYINAPGGRAFYDVEKFRGEGIDIKFIQPHLQPYDQKIGRFEAGLSIIDVLMFNSAEKVRAMLEDYELA